MEVGIIAPIKLLKECCITNIQYCLPSLLLESKEYLFFYEDKVKQGCTLFLDCKKIGWRREPEILDIVKKSLKLITPNYVILPSHMFNKNKTIGIQREFLKKLRGHKLVQCLEGTTKEEISDCLTALPEMEIIIPSHNINTCKDISWSGPITYLDNHLNIEEIKNREGDILITSLPIRLGLQGRLLSDYRPSPPSLTFYEEENKYPTIIKRNIKEVIRYYQ